MPIILRLDLTMEAPIVDLPLPIAAGDLVIPAVSVAPKLPYTVEKVSWTKRDALLFNASIGCKADELHFLYVCVPHARHPLR